MEPALVAALAAVSFCAAAVQAATGFGFAILAVPFFLLILGSLSAIQVTAVANLVLSLVLLPRLVREVPLAHVVWLAAGSAIGFPAGLAVFRAADLDSVKIAVGAIIVLLALCLLWRDWRSAGSDRAPQEQSPFRPRPAIELGVGIVSGTMAGALAMPGPAVMLYFLVRRAGKRVARAATLILFAFSYGSVTAMHALWGGMTGETWLLAGLLLPAVIAGAAVGHVATGRLSEERFHTAVLVILLASGLYALWTAL